MDVITEFYLGYYLSESQGIFEIQNQKGDPYSRTFELSGLHIQQLYHLYFHKGNVGKKFLVILMINRFLWAASYSFTKTIEIILQCMLCSPFLPFR